MSATGPSAAALPGRSPRCSTCSPRRGSRPARTCAGAPRRVAARRRGGARARRRRGGRCARSLARRPPAISRSSSSRLFLTGRPATAHPYESFYRAGLLATRPAWPSSAQLLRGGRCASRTGARAARRTTSASSSTCWRCCSAGLGRRERRAVEACAALAVLARRLVDEHLTPFVAAFIGAARGRGAAAVLSPPRRGATAACRRGSLLAAPVRAAATSRSPRSRRRLGAARGGERRKRRCVDSPHCWPVLLLVPAVAFAQEAAKADEAEQLREDLEEIEERLDKVETQGRQGPHQLLGRLPLRGPLDLGLDPGPLRRHDAAEGHRRHVLLLRRDRAVPAEPGRRCSSSSPRTTASTCTSPTASPTRGCSRRWP